MGRRLFCFFILAAGCGFFLRAAAQEPSPSEKPQAGSSPSAVAYINSMDALDDKRKLAVGDRLSFRVVEDRRPPVAMIVTDSGEVEVPFIGRVTALNKTCKQLAEEIKAPMEKDYFYKATVIVALDVSSEKSLGRVYVTGNVRNAGPLEIPPDENLTVSRAILRAGGFDQFANKHRVKLIRKNPGNPSGTETMILDVGEIIERGDSNKDITVQPDDMIVVPKAIINFN
ncbi:MAG TPA: polysaccharide biosynthesis/export family protein [Chthoniobacteraceae bacterium]|nr:polysaccharide biosynthesis/export family protein [Chthoniobacteraceae bacterium]